MPKVLFVCTANICRSPMAMALFKKKVEEEALPGTWEISSAGTWGMDGNEASKNGQILMAEAGYDLSGHRSRTVDEAILTPAHIILTMERGHKEAIRAEFPAIASRVFTLSEMVGYAVDIADPYGGPLEEYRDTAQEIKEYIDQGFTRIIQLIAMAKPSD